MGATLFDRLDQLQDKKKFVCMKYGGSHLIKFSHSMTVHVIGPHWIGVLFTILVILGGGYINHKMIVKMQRNLSLQWWLEVFNQMMRVLTIVFLVVTAVTNPGIIFPSSPQSSSSSSSSSSSTGAATASPQSILRDIEGEESSSLLSSSSSSHSGKRVSAAAGLQKDRNSNNNHNNLNSKNNHHPSHINRSGCFGGGSRYRSESSEDEEEDGQEQQQYCEHCGVYCTEEMKVKHCMDCGYCIERLDHHCPWMGQCVGRYNMRWFVLFNISWVLYFTQFILLAIFLKI